jgi:hypothetical protein
MLFVTSAHELVHGYFFTIFGGKIKYGFKVLYAYTSETSGKSLSRTQFLVILLAPLTVISLAALAVNGWPGGLIFSLNLLGSSGDILMAFYLCRLDDNAKIIDREYGFDVIV